MVKITHTPAGVMELLKLVFWAPHFMKLALYEVYEVGGFLQLISRKETQGQNCLLLWRDCFRQIRVQLSE